MASHVQNVPIYLPPIGGTSDNPALAGLILEVLNVWMPVPVKIGVFKIFVFLDFEQTETF
jgi:hypothetical protein